MQNMKSHLYPPTEYIYTVNTLCLTPKDPTVFSNQKYPLMNLILQTTQGPCNPQTQKRLDPLI